MSRAINGADIVAACGGDGTVMEAARYRDFDPTEFGSPPGGWQPPYLYHWEDISFVRVNVSYSIGDQ